ncbi:unnamed protein product [Rotaria socialis]|uniref:Uncharacterized protein n=1 Tax=Rotaria socialis TaxID=392032 RepID=A0A821MG15_9BILA|nr:unnamed protein product [Rotaria socialis]CAF4766865.1 unnamed protein product [Rotaria socialis]
MSSTKSCDELPSLTSSISHQFHSCSPNDIESNRTLDNAQIVWFTGGIQNPTDDYIDEIALNMIAPTERIDDANMFVDFVTDIQQNEPNETLLFLIVNVRNEMSEFIIKILHDLAQIGAIYVLQDEHNDYVLCPFEQYGKVAGPFPVVAKFYDQMKTDMLRIKREHECISFDIWRVSDSIDSLNTVFQRKDQQEAAFMFGQLLKRVLVDVSNEDDDSIESLHSMMHYLRQLFANDKAKLNFLQKFENEYKTHTPIYWYSLDSFLYGLVNKALREQNIELLFHIRIFIRDLHQQIVAIHNRCTTMECTAVLPTVLYRGALMPINELNDKILHNPEGLLSVNSFLSTSANKELALVFAGRAQKNTNNMPVLFTISMSGCLLSPVSFAYIDPYINGNEQEYLFSMDAIFRIDRIDRLIDNGVYCIHLKFTNDHDSQLAALTEYVYRQMKGAKLISNIAFLLYEIGDYEKSAQFYLRFLQESNLLPGERVIALSNLGSIYDSAGDHSKALKYYLKTLDIEQKHELSSDRTLCNIGYAYWRLQQYELARKYYQLALNMALSTRDNELIACIYDNIATLLADENDLNQALVYHEKALKIREEHLPPIHKNIAMTHYNTGNLLFRQGNFDDSLKALKQCLHIQLLSLPPDHSDLRMTFTRIADTYRHLGRHEEAFDAIARAMKINLQAIEMNCRLLGSDHPNIQSDLEQLRLLSTELNRNRPTVDDKT